MKFLGALPDLLNWRVVGIPRGDHPHSYERRDGDDGEDWCTPPIGRLPGDGRLAVVCDSTDVRRSPAASRPGRRTDNVGGCRMVMDREYAPGDRGEAGRSRS